MFQRDRLKKVASRSRSDADWTYYKQQKNKVNCNVKKAKITYYNNYFKDNSSNIRNTWRGINFRDHSLFMQGGGGGQNPSANITNSYDPSQERKKKAWPL